MKKATRKKSAVNRDKGKTRFEVRFDDEVAEQLKGLAEEAHISMNQLLHGLARWAVQNPHLGDPQKSGDGSVHSQKGDAIQPGTIWWGRTASYRMRVGEERQQFIREYTEAAGSPPDEDECKVLADKGDVHIRLDFTERRVVRED